MVHKGISNSNHIRVIAYYLPQYHPIPENDKWWGKGFTEWLNVARAKPLYKNHYQPKIPTDLGFYDLRIPEVREDQALLAKKAGIEGFCYWHYWFGNNRQLLERPFLEVLNSGKPDFPFCLGWANHSWTNKSWDASHKKTEETVLMEQIYGGITEYTTHFYHVLKAFKDDRYITVDGKPLFVIFDPYGIPKVDEFIKSWQSLAVDNGLKGIHFVGILQNMPTQEKTIRNLLNRNKLKVDPCRYNKLLELGFNAINTRGYVQAEFKSRSYFDFIWRYTNKKFFNKWVISKCKFADISKKLFTEEDKWENIYPTLLPNWDRSARAGKKARIYHGSTPELFQEQVERAVNYVRNKQEEHRILFLQSWNEWGEGNYIEPDTKFGHGYIDALRNGLMSKNE